MGWGGVEGTVIDNVGVASRERRERENPKKPIIKVYYFEEIGKEEEGSKEGGCRVWRQRQRQRSFI